MIKKEFDSFDDAEKYLTEHTSTCEFREVKLPCQCIIVFPCKECGAPLTKTGVKTLARDGAFCVVCGGVHRADRDRGHKTTREEIAHRARERL